MFIANGTDTQDRRDLEMKGAAFYEFTQQPL